LKGEFGWKSEVCIVFLLFEVVGVGGGKDLPVGAGRVWSFNDTGG